MFDSLDFIYVPTRDVHAAAAHHLGALGAEPLWTVRAMETTVAALRVSRTGPHILLSGHLEGDRPVLVYRVADYQQTVHSPRDRGLTDIRELEIPHGPCAAFGLEGGQRYAVYELRPSATSRYSTLALARSAATLGHSEPWRRGSASSSTRPRPHAAHLGRSDSDHESFRRVGHGRKLRPWADVSLGQLVEQRRGSPFGDGRRALDDEVELHAPLLAVGLH
jgi:hypothetical protein